MNRAASLIGFLCAIALGTGLYAMEGTSQKNEIIQLYYNLLHPGSGTVDVNVGAEIAEELIAFTEEEHRETAISSALALLHTFQARIKHVHALTKQFPCLNNDLAIASLLGFKPMSAVECRDVDYDALKRSITAIPGLKGFYEYEVQRDAIDDVWEQAKFVGMVYITATYFMYEFTIANSDWLTKIESGFTDGDERTMTVGCRYGYDKVNTALFCTHTDSIGMVKTKGLFFGGNQIFWVCHAGGEKSAQIKLRGYEVLLNLARVHWDYLDKSAQ